MSATRIPVGRLPGRKERRRIAAVVLVVMVAAGAGTAAVGPFGGHPKNATVDSNARTGLAQVTRGTLSSRTQENGTLGYAGDYQVVDKASGTITRLPSVGQVVRQGKALYWVDGKPVVLLRGDSTPVYRALSVGMKGADVRQLNAALVALGYATKDDLDPESTCFWWETAYALEELQGDLGLEKTGDLKLGEAVFLPSADLRITKLGATRGGTAAPGTVVLQGSSTQRQVTVSLDASRQSTVAVGDQVTITLPTGTTTPGVVSSVGKVATKSDSKTTIEVRIRPSRPGDTGQLDQAPVQVSIISDTAKDVLSVPVNALLALSGGGYAVEVVRPGGAHRLVPVTTGLFDDSAGTVQVTGYGLAVGQTVVVPAT